MHDSLCIYDLCMDNVQFPPLFYTSLVGSPKTPSSRTQSLQKKTASCLARLEE